MKNYDDEINRICSVIKENVTETKSKGIVIALSGGLDSAVVAVLSAKAMGKENVHCYYLHYDFASSDIDKQHIDLLCNKFGLTYDENRFVSKSPKPSFFNLVLRNVSDAVVTFMENNRLKLVFGNIMATVRMKHLRKQANEHNCLVSGTTNRSEWLIGYFTKLDDGEFDLQPILHLYKTEIVELAKHLGIPDEIINRTPSADLWIAQNNEKEIGMTYQKLDTILKGLDDNIGIENHKEEMHSDSYECEINGVTRDEISEVIKMIERTEHKRSLSP